MLNAGFQFLEQRDAEDNITHDGVVSKKSPFATSDNAGIYDVIAEDLRVLYETLGSTNLASTVNRINDIYNEMLTNPDFGATSAALSAQQAIDAMNSAMASATAAKEHADSIGDAQEEVEADREAVATNTATVQAAIETLREYNEACASNTRVASAKADAASTSAANAKTSEDNAKDSETNAAASEANALASKNSANASANAAALSATQASDSENNASISATNASSSAELSRKWATEENSPDDANDIDSPTTKTQSSRSWALYAKSQAMSASTSAASASDSAASASDSETSANTSAVNAKTSEDNAKVSEQNAKTSEDNAKASETNAATSETNAATSENNALNWAEGSPSDTTNDDGSITKHYSAKHYSEQSGISADNAKLSEDKAAASETNAQQSEDNARNYESSALDHMRNASVSETNAKESETNASASEANAKTSEDNALESENKAREWAVSSNDITVETVAENGETTVEIHQSAKTHADRAGTSEANAATSETNAATSETNAKVSETNAANSADVAMQWAMSNESPDDGFDADSDNGKTQSSKSWAKTAREQAIEATNQKVEVSQYTETVQNVLQQALALQDAITTIQANIQSLTDQANSVLAETRKIRDDLTNAINYKGSVDNYSDLPNENKIGDMYNVKNADKDNDCRAGDNFVWNGTAWDNMGGVLDVDDILNGGKNANFGAVTATSFTGNLVGKADTAGTADIANSVDWSNVQNRPTTMTANGGTADRALKADVCTGNAASASSVAWENVTGKPSTFTPSAHNHAWGNITGAPATATRWPAWGEVTGKPSTFTPASHTHGLLHDSFATALENTATDKGWAMINGSYNGYLLKSIRTEATTPGWILNNYASGIAFGGADTKGVISVSYDGPRVKFAGGNGAKPVWWYQLNGTSGKTYDLNNMPTSWGNVSGKPSTFAPSAHNHAWGNITGAPATATRWPAWSEVTGKPTSMPANGGTSSLTNQVVGTYSGNGGQQKPNYYGRNRVGFLMSNQSINGDGNYKNWLYMDNYNGDDVGGASAIGVSRVAARAFIMSSDKNRTAWNWSAELLSTANYNSYAPTKTGGGASGTWGISVSGNSATSTVAAQIGKGGGTGDPMRFHWSGQGGQPTWLWGGNDGTNMYVWNPANFSVNYANSAGSVHWNNIAGKPSFMTKAVALKGSRLRTDGDWTITGLTANYPLYIIHQSNNKGAAYILVKSGAANQISSACDYRLGVDSCNIIVLIPTATSVVVNIRTAADDGDNFYAYQ